MTKTEETNTVLMHRILAAGFGVVVSRDGTGFCVTSNASADSDCMALAAGYGITLDSNRDSSGPYTPAVHIPMPRSLQIKFIPYNNIRMAAGPAKNPPRIRPENVFLKFDTPEEYQEKLMDDYMEALERIRDQRQSVIDERKGRHEELIDAFKEMEETKPLLVRRDNSKDKFPSMQATVPRPSQHGSTDTEDSDTDTDSSED